MCATSAYEVECFWFAGLCWSQIVVRVEKLARVSVVWRLLSGFREAHGHEAQAGDLLPLGLPRSSCSGGFVQHAVGRGLCNL